MDIRPAESNDLPEMLAILNREIREGVAHFGLVELELAELESEFAGAKARYPWHVACQAGRLAGFARATPWKSRGAYSRTIEVGVYSDSERRSQGVGTALYGQFLPACREAGFRTLLAGIRLPNPACVRLHEKFGFRRVGTLPSVGFKHGMWHDVGYWALVFDDEISRPTSPTR